MSIDLGQKAREAKPVYILIPLLLLNLTLLSLQIEDPAGTMLLRRWVIAAGAPLLSLSAWLTRSVSGAWSEYVWLHGARQENVRLKETLQQFALRDRSLEQVKEENVRLRRLLELQAPPAFRGIGARVVGRTPAYLSHVIYVDRGAGDGVRVDSPVVSGTGVVGRVVLAAAHISQVQLVTNGDASLGGLIEQTRSPGVVRGQGGTLLDMDYIGNADMAEVGTMVLTSGLDGIFPKGLPVGRIVESKKGKSVFRTIKVEPATDVLHLEEVLILLPAAAADAGGNGVN